VALSLSVIVVGLAGVTAAGPAGASGSGQVPHYYKVRLNSCPKGTEKKSVPITVTGRVTPPKGGFPVPQGFRLEVEWAEPGAIFSGKVKVRANGDFTNTFKFPPVGDDVERPYNLGVQADLFPAESNRNLGFSQSQDCLWMGSF
jgi:hypothetical protein